ncbi:MAG: hypothetical protein ACJ8AG_28265 [Ktedonobacteraceae bacterium]|jgi:hypothetical protein
METIIDYALVLVFFLVLSIFVVKVLSTHPYTVPDQTAEVITTEDNNTMISYAGLSILLAFLIVITFLSQRKGSHAHSA